MSDISADIVGHQSTDGDDGTGEVTVVLVVIFVMLCCCLCLACIVWKVVLKRRVKKKLKEDAEKRVMLAEKEGSETWKGPEPVWRAGRRSLEVRRATVSGARSAAAGADLAISTSVVAPAKFDDKALQPAAVAVTSASVKGEAGQGGAAPVAAQRDWLAAMERQAAP